MKPLTRNETANFFVERDHFAILTHRRPDGDTVGSAAALCRILRNQGKTAHVLENPEVTDRYAYLFDGISKSAAAENDVLVAVDVAAPNMLPVCFEQYLDSIALRIDHHGSATSFTEYELVDPQAAACAEIIYDVMMELWGELDRNTAEAMYIAVSTDTGCFRFSNTTDHTFLVAAACAAAGAPIYELNQKLFETNTLAKLRMQAWIVEHLKMLRCGRRAIVAIPKAVEEAIGVTEDDMDNISNFPRTVAGVQMAATLRQTRDGMTKISIRAIPGFDATQVAKQFGGGGHKGAAGASTHMSLEETAAAVERAMTEEMDC